MPKLLCLLTSLLILCAANICAQQASAKTGKIVGQLTDAITGEALVGVSVAVEGTKLGAVSDLDGNYTIRAVPVGTYVVRASSVGYSPVSIQEVTVVEGQNFRINISLETQMTDAKEIIVKAKAVTNTESALLKHRQAAKVVSDAISSEAIIKSGSSDAAEAMTKVVGATVVDGKFAYVRGLGERYSNTQLNGALLPSPDPDKQAVPMDMILSGLLDNIVVTKTFSPDKAGNFSGGSIDMRTKDFPETQIISVTTSAGHNNQSSSNGLFLSSTNGNSTVPTMWNTEVAQGLGNDALGFTTAANRAHLIDNLSNSFIKNMKQERKSGPIDRSYGISYGNSIPFIGRTLGVNASFNYKMANRFYDDGIEGRFINPSGASEELVLQHYLHDTKSSEEELYGGLANLAYSMHTNHKLGISYVTNRAKEHETRFLEGGYPNSFNINSPSPLDTLIARLEARVIEQKETTMNSLQFKGEHALSLGAPIRAKWQASFSRSELDVPDLRFFNHQVIYYEERENQETGEVELVKLENPDYSVDPSSIDILPTRFFRNIQENNDEFVLDFSAPLSKAITLKTGAAYLEKERMHDERVFRYKSSVPFTGVPQEYVAELGYDSVNIGTAASPVWQYRFNRWIVEATTDHARYNGFQRITGYYGLFDLTPFQKLNITAGARYEQTEMFVENGFASDNAEYKSGKIDVTDLLPSVNLVYNLSSTMNLRSAYGKTLARPTIREFAPYGSEDFGGSGKVFSGNKDLERTLIDNYDLRWEWFVRSGEIVAISGFYKSFENPIELAILGTNANQVQPINVDKGTLYGAEFEIRKKLDFVAPQLKYFDIGANLTLVDSKVDIPQSELLYLRQYDPKAEDTRPMYNQSPYVVNVSAGYENPVIGTTMTIQFNRIGERFAVNSAGGTPDVYENPRSIFDLIVSQRIFAGFSIKATGKNLTDSRALFTYKVPENEYIYRSTGTGRTLSLGLSFKFE